MNVQFGDTVLLKEKISPRADWLIGIVTSVMPDFNELICRIIIQPYNKLA